jgi:hypothetical protein
MLPFLGDRMMGKNYHKKTNRSRRKVQELKDHAITPDHRLPQPQVLGLNDKEKWCAEHTLPTG